jgi:type I restriction enzyme R subunit
MYRHYIDKYTMRQSIMDGTTLRIVYEGRTHQAQLTDQAAAEGKFADVFSEYELGEKLRILGYATRQAYLEAMPVIRAKTRDMLRTSPPRSCPAAFKGQLVGHLPRGRYPLLRGHSGELPILVAELEAYKSHQCPPGPACAPSGPPSLSLPATITSRPASSPHRQSPAEGRRRRL